MKSRKSLQKGKEEDDQNPSNNFHNPIYNVNSPSKWHYNATYERQDKDQLLLLNKSQDLPFEHHGQRDDENENPYELTTINPCQVSNNVPQCSTTTSIETYDEIEVSKPLLPPN